MKKFLFSVLVLCFASNAFAIAGIGAHYLINTGSLKSDRDTFSLNSDILTASVNHEKSKSLNGLGFKLWVDILPFVDIEGTFNMAFASYNSNLIITSSIEGAPEQIIPIQVDLGIPFYSGKIKPMFSEMNGDLSVTYPFTFLPIIRPYLGAGLSYVITTPIVNAKFMEGFVEKVGLGALSGDVNPAQLTKELTNFFKDESFTTGIGCHLLAGLRAKLPIIPIAAYVNAKYYLGGNLPKKFDNGLVLEIGGGFAL